MLISMICCPFQTSFGSYGSSLRAALEKKTGNRVQWVASNCGCGDPVEAGRKFQTTDCDYFDMPMLTDYPSNRKWKRWGRRLGRSVMVHFRTRRYAELLRDADVAHFHQILNAYGSKGVFSWLNRPSGATRIVTVHELDEEQLDFPETNTTYNRADGIIVHCQEMKERLIRLGVQAERIHVVLHGTTMPALLEDGKREGVLFYGGHKLMSGKGVETLFQAMAIVQRRLGASSPVLKIHGHYGTATPAEAIRLAAQYGVADGIVWLNQLPEPDMVELYRRSLLCVLPYTGSFAGLAASLAAACALPVAGTRKAGLPDHLGDLGLWMDENSPEQLADHIITLSTNDRIRQEAGARLRKRAHQFLRWDVIADRTLAVYDKAVMRKSGGIEALALEAHG